MITLNSSQDENGFKSHQIGDFYPKPNIVSDPSQMSCTTYIDGSLVMNANYQVLIDYYSP